ncbi:MAG TPA: hypothetical protein EYN80_03535 [Alphaproteobacteria bacterium]|nr:hypothetical protein [Alphaproteobacteria bacterium]
MGCAKAIGLAVALMMLASGSTIADGHENITADESEIAGQSIWKISLKGKYVSPAQCWNAMQDGKLVQTAAGRGEFEDRSRFLHGGILFEISFEGESIMCRT